MNKRQLILEDGTTFTGQAFGSLTESEGEVIFNTSMTGYQEIISDPSYYGQIVVMTYPSIGSYGINRDDFEAITPFIKGVIAKEVSDEPSNFRSEETLDAFLKQYEIPGIAGIDTRMLTRLLREKGTMKGLIAGAEMDLDTALSHLKSNNQHSFVEDASITRPYIVPGRGKRIVIVDFGMKHSILHELTERNCHVTVVPYNYGAEEVMRFKPDGIVLSHGPGNPGNLAESVALIKSLFGVPMLGIGLGHQLFALACGAKTKRMKNGKYGSNYPVKDVKTDKSWLTTQSRAYEVVESSLKDAPLQVTFRSINDDAIEGLAHKEHPAISVQFNPEGAPGPNETNFIFDQFLNMIARCQAEIGGVPNA